jgi:hypothetical protein
MASATVSVVLHVHLLRHSGTPLANMRLLLLLCTRPTDEVQLANMLSHT